MCADKILVVDDEPNMRETIKELLVFKNYDVKAATNGEEALNLLKYWIPDLIISDMVMPVMDGKQLYKNVKKNHSLNFLPFIFLSAKNEIDIINQCLSAGADGFLVKPFKIDQLIYIVNTALQGQKKKKEK